MPPSSPELEHARDLAACREILAQGSKSFGTWRLAARGVFRTTPAAALYAFCRVADDAVDDVRARRGFVALDGLRRRLDAIFDGRPGAHPADRALAWVAREHALPRAPLDALIEGFAWDLEERSYATLDELYAYAARVAGSVGVLMTVLMGVREASTLARACDLGVAMQLTNIARDVGEDARRGRVYLPETWLREVGIAPLELVARPRPSAPLAAVVERLVAAADVLYARADAGIARLPRDCQVAIHAARLIYSDLHRELARQGYDSVSRRAVVSKPRKLLWVLRAYLRSLGRRPISAHAVELPPLAEVRFLLPSSTS
ncbi:MAG: phytoene/squalene synthase family protein [Polyangiaceae bacterium]